MLAFIIPALSTHRLTANRQVFLSIVFGEEGQQVSGKEDTTAVSYFLLEEFSFGGHGRRERDERDSETAAGGGGRGGGIGAGRGDDPRLRGIVRRFGRAELGR